MNILLISPPHYRLFDFSLDNIIPWGLTYIASVIKKSGHKVKIYCTEFNKELTSLGFRNFNLLYIKNRWQCYKTIEDINAPIWDEIEGVISSVMPDIVGITSVTPTYDSAVNISKIVKKIDNKIPVIFGGIHSSIFPEDVIKEDTIDFVVKGEGEETFSELIESINRGNDFKNIRGISYKSNGEIINNYHRPLIGNLDAIPFPAIDSIINYEDFPLPSLGYILTSRGCPYECSFCASCAVWTRKLRLRSPENVLSQIKFTKERYRISQFCFFDDTFTYDKRRVEKICELICAENLKISWGCYTRLDALDENLLLKMKKSGCANVSVGIETASDKNLEKMGKGFSTSEIIDKVKLIKKNGIKINGFVILGFPDDKEEDFSNLKKFVKKIKIDTPDMSVMTPYPGSNLYEKMKEKGKIPSNLRWYAFYPHNPEMNLTTIEQSKFENLLIDFAKFQHRFRLKNKMKLLFSNPNIFLKWTSNFFSLLFSKDGKGIKKIIKLFSFNK
ncbi:MAG: radical SAM protein [Candidatus Schekmanbacteria bacterium]|nr:MAG: radical SAM protein [Candidatus Schekmanbacteria bacterium]